MLKQLSAFPLAATIFLASTAGAQATTPATLPGHTASETPLSLSMWAGQTDPGTVRLAWNHIPEATSYVITCMYGTSKPTQVATIDATGVAPIDDNGLPHRFNTTVPVRQSGVERCSLQWRRTARGILSARLPFNDVTLVKVPPAGVTDPGARAPDRRYRLDSAAWSPARVRAEVNDSLFAVVTWRPVDRATGYEVYRAFRGQHFESIGYVNATNAGSRVEFRDYLGGLVTSRKGVTARYAVRSVDDEKVRSALTGSNEVSIPAGTPKPGARRAR